MLLDSRKLTILFAVIDEYVTTAEPVASQAIVSRRAVDAGPATIRNEMATLEEDGYLMRPSKGDTRMTDFAGWNSPVCTYEQASSQRMQPVQRVG
jgi:heat-inducible transcriptional repressor